MDELSPVRFEHHREALGIGEAAPRLTWLAAATPGWQQAAYELAVGDEVFRVASAASVLVPWPAAPLRPREARAVRVRAPPAWCNPPSGPAPRFPPMIPRSLRTAARNTRLFRYRTCSSTACLPFKPIPGNSTSTTFRLFPRERVFPSGST